MEEETCCCILEEFVESLKCFWVAFFEGITLWHDLGSLAGHGATPNNALEIFIDCCPIKEHSRLYQALDTLHANALDNGQELLELVQSCNNWEVSNILLPKLHSSHFSGEYHPLVIQSVVGRTDDPRPQYRLGWVLSWGKEKNEG